MEKHLLYLLPPPRWEVLFLLVLVCHVCLSVCLSVAALRKKLCKDLYEIYRKV